MAIAVPVAGSTISVAGFGSPVAVKLGEHDRRMPVRAERTTNSTGTTTEVGVLRLDDLPAKAGKYYKILAYSVVTSTVNTDTVGMVMRHTTDGSTPTTSSTQLQLAQDRIENNSFPPTKSLLATYAPGGADTVLSLLLTVKRSAGTGTASLLASSANPITMIVEEYDIDPTDTGTEI